MKKYLFLVSLLGIILMSGCQGSTNASPQNTSAQTNQVENSPTIETPDVVPTESLVEVKRDDTDFRNAKWGEDEETVKKYEAEITLTEGENQLLGETSIGGYDSYVGFLFDNNALYQGIYAFALDYSNAGQYIPTYDNLKNMLTQKYGNPYEDEIIPLAKQNQIDYAGPASALEYGYVVYRSQWETDTTNIMIGMSAENYDVKLLISYTDKNYEPDINDSGL